MVLRIFLVLTLFIYSISLSALVKDDAQITLCEDAINLVLKKALLGSELKDPYLHIGRNSFVFEGVYPISIIIFPMDVSLKFVGDIQASSGNIYINVKQYYQHGVEQEKQVAVDRIKRIIKAINKYSFENLDYGIKAYFKDSSTYQGRIFIDMSGFPLVSYMPSLKIRKIKCENKFVTISSTSKILANNQADIQGHVGEKVLNALLRVYTEYRRPQPIKFQEFSLDIEEEITVTADYLKNGNSNTLTLKTELSLPKENLARLSINSHESANEVLLDEEMLLIVKALNTNLQDIPNMRGDNIVKLATTFLNKRFKGQDPKQRKANKLKFTYKNNALEFNADFASLLSFDIDAQVFSLKAGNDMLSLSGRVD